MAVSPGKIPGGVRITETTGSSASCPFDAFASASIRVAAFAHVNAGSVTVCRQAAGPCDAAEVLFALIPNSILCVRAIDVRDP